MIKAAAGHNAADNIGTGIAEQYQTRQNQRLMQLVVHIDRCHRPYTAVANVVQKSQAAQPLK